MLTSIYKKKYTRYLCADQVEWNHFIISFTTEDTRIMKICLRPFLYDYTINFKRKFTFENEYIPLNFVKPTKCDNH